MTVKNKKMNENAEQIKESVLQLMLNKIKVRKKMIKLDCARLQKCRRVFLKLNY